MNTVIIVVIAFLASLFVVVFLHELGHFLTAKRAGVKVEEFGIGLPPRIFGIKRGETIYSLNAIPLGAFVKTPSENDPTVTGSLASKGAWTRFGVYAAGPLVNILLAFILLSVFFALPTNVVAGSGVMVQSVLEGSPAQEAGIKTGDIISTVNGRAIRTWQDLQNAINSGQEGEKITLVLQRSGSQNVELELIPSFDPSLQRRTIGVLLCWNIVSQVSQGSLGEEAGIKPGDTILDINGQPIYSSESLSRVLQSVKTGEQMSLLLLRGNETTSASLVNEPDVAHQLDGLELSWVSGAHIEPQRLPAMKAVHLGGSYIIDMPLLIINAIPLIRQNPSLALVGPVGAGQLTVEVARSLGFSSLLFMASILSLGVGLFNFLPVPPLDGGGMLVAFIEGIRRGKRLSFRAVQLAYAIGTALLITLMVVVTFSDVFRLVTGGSFGL